MAQDFINLRNTQAEVGSARNYHEELLVFAAGKRRQQTTAPPRPAVVQFEGDLRFAGLQVKDDGP